MNTELSGRQSYNILARKYRPQNFEDLIGQDHVVQTIENSFKKGRIAQAWILTGIRGVGKTTTARILARALNYKSSNIDQPTVNLTELGDNCAAIMSGSHTDVIEVDAASHTSVDNIREIIEQTKYKPLHARYKIYIIDEVHMLSNQAFNALLKTLEEPPEHAKFIFATTEIQKVPLTILSRCQRFDLRRIDATLVTNHLKNILGKEGLKAEDEALLLIARAGEGSLRDSLSLLDQAIAYSDDIISTHSIIEMLGLSSIEKIIELFENIIANKAQEALDLFNSLYKRGADPINILRNLAEYNHLVMQIKIIPGWEKSATILPIEAEHGVKLAKELSVSTIERNWRIIQSSIYDANRFSNAKQCCEMAIIRLCHAAALPNMDDLVTIMPLLLERSKQLTEPINTSQVVIEKVLEKFPETKISITDKI